MGGSSSTVVSHVLNVQVEVMGFLAPPAGTVMETPMLATMLVDWFEPRMEGAACAWLSLPVFDKVTASTSLIR